MTRPALQHAKRSLNAKRPLAAVGGLAAFLMVAAPASAQGTAAQREACTPDAIRLCPDTIPDVDRTTACMKAHEAQLSRRCHRVFSAETETPAVRPDDRMRRSARAPRPDDDDVDARLSRGDEDGYMPRRYAPDAEDGYDTSRRYAPDAEDGYDAPRRYGPGAEEEYDVPRRAERGDPDAYGDGYGPRRYLYMTPRGPAQTPDDAD